MLKVSFWLTIRKLDPTPNLNKIKNKRNLKLLFV